MKTKIQINFFFKRAMNYLTTTNESIALAETNGRKESSTTTSLAHPLAELRERREEDWTVSKAAEWRDAHLASREENEGLKRDLQSLRDELVILRSAYTTLEKAEVAEVAASLVDSNVSTLRGQLLQESRERLEATTKALREREEESERLAFALRRLEEGGVTRLAEELQRVRVLGEARGRLIDSLDTELTAVRADGARMREENARMGTENARLSMDLAAERERGGRLEAELARQIALNEKLTTRLVTQGDEMRAVKSSVMLVGERKKRGGDNHGEDDDRDHASREELRAPPSSSSHSKSHSRGSRDKEIMRRDHQEIVARAKRYIADTVSPIRGEEEAFPAEAAAAPPLSFVSEDGSSPPPSSSAFASFLRAPTPPDKSLQLLTLEALKARLGEVVREARAFREESGRERAALIGSLAAAEARARAERRRAEEYRRDVKVSRFLAKQAVGRLAVASWGGDGRFSHTTTT